MDQPQTVEQRLQDLGINLPEPPPPVAAYVGVVRVGPFVVTAGQLPIVHGQMLYPGRVGSTVTIEQAAEAAQWCAINAVAQLRQAVGSLDRVTQIIRVDGYVAGIPGFVSQPAVLNGASEWLVRVFGEKGRHTRVAIGAADLPLGACVELALWAAVDSY